jgi:membrane protease subunit HflK
MQTFVPSSKPPSPSPQTIIRLLILGIFLLVLFTGIFKSFYTVPAESEGVVIRFGKHVDTVSSGLCFKLPWIDEVVILPVQRQLKQEFGFSSEQSSSRSRRSRRRSLQNHFQASSTSYRSKMETLKESNMVTGDLNAAQVEWVIQYRIGNSSDFLFKVRHPEDTLRDLSEAVMREMIGDRTVDEVITVGRQEIELQVRSKLQEKCNEYKLGLKINQVQLKNVNPPKEVQPSFNEVNQAQQEREQAINEANGEYNRAVPKARGEADQKIQAAQGYLDKRVNEAEGDVARFNALFREYSKAPQVTKIRLFLETMGEILPKIKDKVIIDEEVRQVLPLLNLPSSKGGQ